MGCVPESSCFSSTGIGAAQCSSVSVAHSSGQLVTAAAAAGLPPNRLSGFPWRPACRPLCRKRECPPSCPRPCPRSPSPGTRWTPACRGRAGQPAWWWLTVGGSASRPRWEVFRIAFNKQAYQGAGQAKSAGLLAAVASQAALLEPGEQPVILLETKNQ